MTKDDKKVVQNADLKHLIMNPDTGTYSWDGGK